MIAGNELREAAAIVIRVSDLLLATSSEQKGRAGSDLRRACGDIRTNAETYIVENMIADKLAECFELARQTGATLDEFDRIRQSILTETPVSLIATLMKNACLHHSLQHMALTTIAITFTSREDIEAVMAGMNAAFSDAEESAADEMQSPTYRALIMLHAAVTAYLVETARPLPRMLRYHFTMPRPTLVLSHRLYDTAARADELREENKIVHPAFAPGAGRALAF